ncbi:MAG: ribonuclease R [Clostridia bacterium]|nr:ribonuclease R [Clostridia bacterium]
MERYENFNDKVLLAIKNCKKKVITEQFLFAVMGMKTSFDMQAIKTSLNQLVKEDKIVRTARGKYMLAEFSSFLRAKIIGTRNGYAFARVENGDEDIFVAEKNLAGAVHGDTVLISIERPNFKGKHQSFNARKSAIVEKIVERGVKTLVGLFTINNGAHLVVPDDPRFADSIFIAPSDTMNAPHGSKVVVKIIDYPSRTKMALGKVVEVLGDARDAKVSTLSIIRSFNLIEEFPEKVEKEAAEVSHDITPEERKGRTDYTKDLVITIDGEDARDFDDAFSLEKRGDKYYLNVHIADVSHYVKEGGELDQEAFKRGTSVYFPDYVLPMLPKSLSNGICSLNPDVDRLTMSVEMVVDNKGNVVDYNINKGIIHSSYRMTYTLVTKILDGDEETRKKYAEICPMLDMSAELAKLLIKKRDDAGQLDFDLPEPQIIVDENYNTVDIIRHPRELSHRLIEQFMVLTNEVVAKHFDQLNLPFVFRVHENPTPERVANFAAFASSLGLKLNKSATPKDFQKLLIAAKDQTYSSALSKIMLRSMQKARYAPENLGHFGLALRNYCHFTSPIRRYPDLSIHRIISYMLEGKLTDKKISELYDFVEESSAQSSTTERNAEQAERTVDDQKKAEFMADKIGRVYRATISGATENGVWAELDNTVEGMIATEKLPADRYMYDQKKFALCGKKHIYRIGDPVVVKVDSVDILTRRVDFSLATEEDLEKNQ